MLRITLALLLGVALVTPGMALVDGSGPDTIELNVPGLDHIDLGGQFRMRSDWRDPSPALTGADSAHVSSMRVRVHMEAKVDDYVGAFVQFQNAIQPIGATSNTTLHQAYVTYDQLFGMDWQAGRMELSYGDQRMVSHIDWSNTGRAWDGLRVSKAVGAGNVDLFWTQPVIGQGGNTNDENFFGLYSNHELMGNALDLYVLRFHDTALNGPDRMTLGGLLKGEMAAGMNYSLEMATQSGEDISSQDISASAFAGTLTYALSGGHKLGLEYSMASGTAAGASDNGTFQSPYTFGHAYQGHADAVSWSNMSDLVFKYSMPVNPTWRFHADYHIFSVMESDGGDTGWMGGQLAGATAVAGEDAIGTELDLYMKGKLGDSTGVWLGVSQFMAGDAISGGDDQTWLFGQFVVNF